NSQEVKRLKLLSAKPRPPQRICDFGAKNFWNWSDFHSYLDCMLIFTIVASILMYIFIEYIIFVELVGFMAVFTEALLGVPQLIKNYRSKSTEGMSLSMVILWTCGDIFKTLYFLLRSAPVQFWICGSMQVTIDLLILLQAESPVINEVSENEDNNDAVTEARCVVEPIDDSQTHNSHTDIQSNFLVSADIHNEADDDGDSSDNINNDNSDCIYKSINGSCHIADNVGDRKFKTCKVTYKKSAKVSMLIHRHTL
ncbi:hypothetical protein GWI33_004146, partial [Rhynchophorus ferrugineus]